MESSSRLMFRVLVSTLLWLTCCGQHPPYPTPRYRNTPYPPTYIIHRSSPSASHVAPSPPMPYYRQPRPVYGPPPQPYPVILHGQSSYDRPVVIRMRRKRPVIIMEEAYDSSERPIIIRKRPKKAKRSKLSQASSNDESREESSRISQFLGETSNDPYGTRYKIAGTFHLDNRGNLVGINSNDNTGMNDIKATDSTEVDYN